MGLHEAFNLAEGVVWVAIGAALLISAAFNRRLLFRLRIVAAISFVLFGISDFIEMRTGSWWNPSWLLSLKALCVITLAACLWVYMRRKGKSHGDNDRAAGFLA